MNDEIKSLAARLGVVLGERGLTVTTAESCTGGGIAYAITSVAGSSNWFEEGVVTYSNDAKQSRLQVSSEALMRCGAVSEEVVKEMTLGALQHTQAQLAIAVSGIAGPGGGTAEKPVGLVWVAWRFRDLVVARSFHFSGDREQVRLQSIVEGLRGAIAMLESNL
ncbi:nicotinamide-nucleotide amidohydrolase family protein [Hahella sp. KA22]|uniref:CinA family protein n=1 Tax=Hahella sp. KA22 TaxID=1628392 RepID=UPI000FDCED86|nr:CinA family protein [Hahella sp. KA22]AZZ90932.1 CinA family protein [Hahella sp. KA22]QAY54302.1 nicotinamide-nucleotide amidohydrolase family protein [Hahella sp. KA22]